MVYNKEDELIERLKMLFFATSPVDSWNDIAVRTPPFEVDIEVYDEKLDAIRVGQLFSITKDEYHIADVDDIEAVKDGDLVDFIEGVRYWRHLRPKPMVKK